MEYKRRERIRNGSVQSRTEIERAIKEFTNINLNTYYLCEFNDEDVQVLVEKYFISPILWVC